MTEQRRTIKRTNREPLTLGVDDEGNQLKGYDLFDYMLDTFGKTLILSFSGGKDSLALWLELEEYGKFELVPYYLWWIPGSPYERRVVEYYEKFFGYHILKFPAPLHYHLYQQEMFQLPHTAQLARTLDLPSFRFVDIENLICDHYGYGDAYTAVGFRAADNIHRSNLIKQQGAVGRGERRYFFGIWDWNLERTCRKIVDADVKISKYYDVGSIGTTPLAWDYKFIKPLMDSDPESWEVFKQWFPLADLEMFRQTLGKGKHAKN